MTEDPKKRFLSLTTAIRAAFIGMALVYVIIASLTYFDVIESYLYPLHYLRGRVVKLSNRIIIGAYPHRDEMEKIKSAYGVTTIVSLLNLDLPQEKALYEKELKVAAGLNIPVVSFPLQYLSLDSDANRENVRKLVEFIGENNTRIIYLHCYLGKHRVNYVKDGLRKAALIPADIK